MATERQAPDTIAAQTELSGAVTDIDDDPDAPDGLWLTASGNNVDTDVRVTFPTPDGSPTFGADLQEFRAQVRQFDEDQTGIPGARIELWENGALVRAGSDESVKDGGVVVSFTWNTNELATADGSLVECKVVGTKTGGATGDRNTVEVGAVEWNASTSHLMLVNGDLVVTLFDMGDASVVLIDADDAVCELINADDITTTLIDAADADVVLVYETNGVEPVSMQLGQKGLIIRRTIKDELDAAVDISGFTTKEFLLRSPKGVNTTHDASFTTDGTDGEMEFVTVVADLDEEGTWQIQAHLVDATDDHYSAIMTFQVIGNLTE